MALLERPPVVGTDSEALFKEARRRRRRRWLVGSCVALVAASIAATVGLVAKGPGQPTQPARPKTPTVTATQRPLVNLRSFDNQGRLAFVSRSSLWILDGDAHTLRQVPLPKGLVPLAPTFSPDGRWLAFVTGSTPLMRGSLWMARSNGTGAHRVAGLVLGDAFGWSTRSDLYAVATGPLSTRAPFGQPTTVRLVSPSGSARTVATAPAIVGAAWSPDGSSLAVSTLDHKFVPSLDSYSVARGTRTAWPGAPDARGAFVIPTGWWNEWGVVYTVIDNGAVPDGEGSFEDAALYSLASPGATPRYLGETLTNDSDGPASVSSTGLLTFVSDAGRDPRTPWNGKQVQVCSPASVSCSAVPTPTGDVTEDPVWSPSGSILAYVAAPSMTTDEFLPSEVSSWYNAHALELYDPTTHSASQVGGAPGGTVPVWSSNGHSLLYVADNGLWLSPSTAPQPVEILSPLFGPTHGPLAGATSFPSYYGETDWSQQFSWSHGAPVTQCYVACDAT